MRLFVCVVLLSVPGWLLAQPARSTDSGAPKVPAPTIEEYEPRTVLVVEKTEVPRAKFPFVDVHTHHRNLSSQELDKLIRDMDSLNMGAMVNSPVRGSFGAATKKLIDAIAAHPQRGRFATMTNINYGDLTNAAKQLEADIKAGAVGVKVWKNFGMTEKDAQGKRIPVDDPRLDDVWQVAAKYRVPVMIHTADPKPLFDPMDIHNERWLELRLRPNRGGGGTELTWDQLMREQHNLFARHKETTFINAHMGWMSHDLKALGELMDKCPNLYLEFAAILGELGRQPRAANRFFTKYQDRILFGKDRYDITEYPFYFRMLETDDEWISNIRKYHGLWQLYALDLSDEVLKKIYYKNALKLFPSLDRSRFPE